MRAAVQRVREASVLVAGEVVGRIGHGLLVYLGVAQDDNDEDAREISRKIAGLRVFPDAAGKMNLDVTRVGGAVLLVSAFTLMADARQGRRPAFDAAAPPDQAERLYERVVADLRAQVPVETGRFRAAMSVASVNEGPIHILFDSRGLF